MTPDAAARLEFITDVLEMLDVDNEPSYGDLEESIFKCVNNREVVFIVNANDLFYWACADGVTLTPENLPMLKQAVLDVRVAYGLPRQPDPMSKDDSWDKYWHAGSLGAELFCCRVRGMRPQRPCYKNIPPELHPLFDACGPERDRRDEG